MQKVFLIALVVSGFCVGMLADRTWLTFDNSTVSIVHEEAPAVPVLEISKIGDGYLRGEVQNGEIRVTAGALGGTENPLTGEIAVPLADAFVNYEVNEIPEGAQFVGSRNSNKYHPLNSTGAKQILPKNRVYFLNVQEAEWAGYVPAQY